MAKLLFAHPHDKILGQMKLSLFVVARFFNTQL